jgi:hypothetical protein
VTPDDYLTRCVEDFEFYAGECLRILDKRGELVPLRLNRAQQYVHARLERQLAETGKVRAFVLKGRQQGISTYIQARWRWRVKHRTGVKAYVLAHEQKASDNLFDMAKRYHSYEPEFLRPHTGAANSKELWFDEIDSRYEVATAGTKETGRSGTAQFLHGSEGAFWPNAAAHWKSIGQTVPDMAGTEIVIESTANGKVDVGAEFYRRWKRAEAGLTDYIAIFVPWFWQDEYRKPIPAGFKMDADEEELAERHELTPEQVYWRRMKIADDFGGDETGFHQEYPNSANEAFIATNRDTLLDPERVAKARGTKVVPQGPLVLGVDPARHGPDRTVICWRRGRQVSKLKVMSGKSVTQVAGQVAIIIEQDKPTKVFIDTVGLGAGVYDVLDDGGYGKYIVAVGGAEKPVEEDRYRNKRAECWGRMKEWFNSPPVQIPDSDEFEGDLLAPGYTYDAHSRLLIEPKDKIREREGRSPDMGDALALTFAENVRDKPKRDRAITSAYEPEDSVAGY